MYVYFRPYACDEENCGTYVDRFSMMMNASAIPLERYQQHLQQLL